MSEVDRLYAVANEAEISVLDALRERAGILWTCTNHEVPRCNYAPFPCGYCGKELYPDLEGLEEWDGPTLLRWLAAHTADVNHYFDRAMNWEGEVDRFAAYEGMSPAEWEANALEELCTMVRERRHEGRGEHGRD